MSTITWIVSQRPNPVFGFDVRVADDPEAETPVAQMVFLEADAHLLAAAPELHEALRSLLLAIEGGRPDGEMNEDLLDKARHALALAGEQS